MQFLKVHEECKDFNSFKRQIELFLQKNNYNFTIIVPPYLNLNDEMPAFYNIPCYLKKRKNSFAVYVDLYVEDISPINAIIILSDELNVAEEISKKLSFYLMN